MQKQLEENADSKEALREANEKLQAVLNSITDGLALLDKNWCYTYINQQGAQLIGMCPEGLIGNNVWQLFPHAQGTKFHEFYHRAVNTGKPVHFEEFYPEPLNLWLECRCYPSKDGLSVYFHDITARKKADAVLRQNEALFSAVVDLAPTGMYVVDSKFRLQQINARAMPAFAQVEHKIGRDFGEVMKILWGPEVGEQLSGIFRHTLATGEPYRSPRFAEHRVDLNEDKAYEWETQRVTLPDGAQGVVCYFNDITETERHKANLAFLAMISDDLLRLETVDDVMNIVGARICDYLKLTIGCFVEINEAADISNVTHEWRRPGVPSLLGIHRLSDYLSTDFQKVLRAGNCFIVRDTTSDPRTDSAKYESLKLRSFICVPLIIDGKWKFMFDIHDSKPRNWRDDEIGLVRELTARIWTRLERVRADSLLRQNEGLFAALIDQAPMGVYVIDSQFRVQQINSRAMPAFEKVQPKIGRSLTDVMHIQWGKEAGDELAAIFRHTLDTGEPYVSPGYSNTRADLGLEKTYEWQARRVTLPDGQYGVVCYFNDITQRIQSEQALLKAKAAAESASRSKDNFLAALSHELRTPLNPALLIASESADNHELPETTRLNFETIRKNIELEASLIDDLLDLTRITAGKMVLNKNLVNIHEILKDAIATTQAEQQEKKLHLDIQLNAPQFMVEGDAVRLQQVFWNVLKNAVKFTPPKGKITLETSVKEGDQLLIKFTDTGIGMSAAEVARVFTAFAQGDHADDHGPHRFGGLGLGMAISKNLVEMHSGKIVAESAGLNQGAVFTIELPLAKKFMTRPQIGNGPSTKNPAEPFKEASDSMAILLVEDHEITRTVLTQLLTRRNYEVIAVDSAAKARETASQNKFDLLISDIGLPDGNGNDLMNEFREKYGIKGIALTGYGMEEDIARGKAAGFVTHLIKPVKIQSLENALSIVKGLPM